MTQKYMETRPDNHSPQFQTGIDNGGGSVVLGVSFNHRFAMFVDDTLIYEGEFEPSAISSYMPIGIYIGDVARDNSKIKKDILSDTFGFFNTQTSNEKNDAANNMKLYEFLEENGLLQK